MRLTLPESPSVPPRPVLKYYLYQATMSQGFIVPILAEFVLSRGLSFAELGALDAVFMASWTLGEIPTGYVGDRVGRRNSLILSSVLTAGAVLAFGLVGSFAGFAVAYVAWAVGVTFRSGTGSAWLYDLLEERLDEDRFSHVVGRGQAVWLGVTAVTSIAGAALAELNWTYPFLANAALIACSVVVLLTFPSAGAGEGDEDDDPFTVLAAGRLLVEELPRPELRSFVAYTALFFGLVSTVETFTQPVSTAVGVSVAQLGLLYAGFHVVSAVASSYSGTVKERVGIRRWFLVMPVVVGVAFAVTVALPLVALPAFFLMKAVNRITGPLKQQYVNDRIESAGRATVLSAVSMTGAFAAVVMRYGGGLLADATSEFVLLSALGGGFVAASLLLFAWENPTADAAPETAVPGD